MTVNELLEKCFPGLGSLKEESPKPGHLVMTWEGYLGIVEGQVNEKQFDVFLGNGIRQRLFQHEFHIVPFSVEGCSPASFHEIVYKRFSEISTVKGKYSDEVLKHFQCGMCQQWWTIGDGGEFMYLHCPRCGTRQEFEPASSLEIKTL